MKAFIVLFPLITFIGCLSQSANSSDNELNLKNDFKNLKVEFKLNSKSQLNRISFPIQSEELGSDGEIVKKTILNKKDWFFINLNNKKYIQNWFYTKKKCRLTIEVLDTGVHVEYIFRLEDKRWVLFKIIDQSS